MVKLLEEVEHWCWQLEACSMDHRLFPEFCCNVRQQFKIGICINILLNIESLVHEYFINQRHDKYGQSLQISTQATKFLAILFTHKS